MIKSMEIRNKLNENQKSIVSSHFAFAKEKCRLLACQSSMNKITTTKLPKGKFNVRKNITERNKSSFYDFSSGFSFSLFLLLPLGFSFLFSFIYIYLFFLSMLQVVVDFYCFALITHCIRMKQKHNTQHIFLLML